MKYLHRIGEHYYFRLRIPKDLQPVLRCKEIKKALRTKYLNNAIKIVELLSYELDNVFSSIRSDGMTEEQILNFLREFVDSSLNKLEDERIDNPLSPEEHKKQLGYYDTIIHHYENRLGTINTRSSEVLLNELLKSKNMQVDRTSPDYRKLRIEFAKAELEVNKIYRERLKGNYNNDYDSFLSSLLPQRSVSNKPKRLLSAVIYEYIELQKANNAWKQKDLKEHTDFYSQFVQIIGDRDIAAYSEQDALRAYNLLKKFPTNWKKKKGLREKSLPEIISLIEQGTIGTFEVLSETTIKKFLIWIRSIFNYAKVTNLFSDFKIKKLKKASEERDEYSKKDLQKWLDSPVYALWKPERVTKNPERFWVPLLMMYSGCRPREACQLYVADIQKIDDIWCLNFNDDLDKSLKTLESKRIVPLHPVLLKLKFLDYVKNTKHVRVFPALVNKQEGEGYAELFTKWSGRYNRQYITKEPKKVPYSLRHTFTTTLSDIKGVEDSLVDEITGHARLGETYGRYHKGYSIKTKHNAIKQLDYGINFSRLKFPFKRG